MTIIVRASLLLFIAAAVPCIANAGTDCKLVEYPDHYEAVCVGDEKYVPQETGNSKPVTVVVTNGERRPPPAVMENEMAARRKLILELRQKDLENSAPPVTAN
jgi:hypothetical protein